MATNEIDDKTDNYWAFGGWITLLVVIVIALTVVIGMSWAYFVSVNRSIQNISEPVAWWGDAFGFVNTVVSALAFAILIVTLFMQKRELELQRQELRLALTEYQKMSKAQDSQAEAQDKLGKAQFLAAYMTAFSVAIDRLNEIGYSTLSSNEEGNERRRTMHRDLIGMIESMGPTARRYASRPSHANRRKALRRHIMGNELSMVTAIWQLPRKIIVLAENLMALAG